MTTLEKSFVTCTIKYLEKTFKLQEQNILPSLDA